MKLKNTQFGSGSLQSRTGGIKVSACLESGLPLPSAVQDIARSDVRLLTDRPLRFGTRINLVLYLNLVSSTVPNVGVVHWCRPSTHGWELGLYLNSPIPESLISKSWWELRQSIRYECHWRAWLVGQEDAPRNMIVIGNYSLCGMKFESPLKLVPGSDIQISHSAAPSVPAYIRGRVERVGQNVNDYGCYLPHESGRFLPSMFNHGSTLHMESPFVEGLSIRSSLLPEMIDKLPTGGFDS